MFKFKKCQKPVRLDKKPETPEFIQNIKDTFKLIKCIIKTPEIMTIIIFIAIFCLIIGFAFHEATTYFVYNRGGI